MRYTNKHVMQLHHVLKDITFRWRTGKEERTPEITALYDSPVLDETVDVVYSSSQLVNWATGWKIAGKWFDKRRGKRFENNQPSIQWV
jgi:hypothetical protein